MIFNIRDTSLNIKKMVFGGLGGNLDIPGSLTGASIAAALIDSGDLDTDRMQANVVAAITASATSAIDIPHGGTGFSSYGANGILLYSSSTTLLSKLLIGTVGQVLAVNSGVTAPEWVSDVARVAPVATVSLTTPVIPV